MLTCITCSKQRTEDGGEDAPRGTPNTKDAVKSLTTQIKDMALKVSGAHKGKPVTTDATFKKGQKSYPDFDTNSNGVPYTYISSSSTPAWDFPSAAHRATRPDSRFTAFGGDRTPSGLESISAQSGEVVLEDEDGPKEWMAQVEPGVQITFVSLPRGGNDLKRIRFSREMFNKWQAQRWWGENYDRIMELYNVQRFNQQALNTPGRSEDGRDSTYSRLGSARESPRMTPSLNKEWTPRYKPTGVNKDFFPPDNLGNQNYGAGSSAYPAGGPKGEMSSVEASRTTTSSRDEASVSVSNASDIESEWIEEDEPGVYITIRQLADGTRELRRVRFSREKFGEVHAKLWWETNRDRIQTQYLC
ncbi:protein brevis radix [Phtheirospermum japonicum]|uniref:Protein brevis radix n=1 Tax=Phtheirospermum japonicum TaxID=374723 RepID=A0A830D7A2_9LAMI|nr:protein brevis radix [Phtheirospermum japonicum]